MAVARITSARHRLGAVRRGERQDPVRAVVVVGHPNSIRASVRSGGSYALAASTMCRRCVMVAELEAEHSAVSLGWFVSEASRR